MCCVLRAHPRMWQKESTVADFVYMVLYDIFSNFVGLALDLKLGKSRKSALKTKEKSAPKAANIGQNVFALQMIGIPRNSACMRGSRASCQGWPLWRTGGGHTCGV